MKTWVLTGHRPDKIGGFEACLAITGSILCDGPRGPYMETIANTATRVLAQQLRDRKPDLVVSGMACGWDQLGAAIAIKHGVRVLAAVPFEGQEKLWPAPAQVLYRQLLRHCQVKYVSPPGYKEEKMQIRNQWMVNQIADTEPGSAVIALWNGTPGGTRNCIDAARRQKKRVENIWTQSQTLLETLQSPGLGSRQEYLGEFPKKEE